MSQPKTEILADARGPGELWVLLQGLPEDAFPVLVKLNREGFHLRTKHDALMFGLGIHCGATLQDEMHDPE